MHTNSILARMKLMHNIVGALWETFLFDQGTSTFLNVLCSTNRPISIY